MHVIFFGAFCNCRLPEFIWSPSPAVQDDSALWQQPKTGQALSKLLLMFPARSATCIWELQIYFWSEEGHDLYNRYRHHFHLSDVPMYNRMFIEELEYCTVEDLTKELSDLSSNPDVVHALDTDYRVRTFRPLFQSLLINTWPQASASEASTLVLITGPAQSTPLQAVLLDWFRMPLSEGDMAKCLRRQSELTNTHCP